MAERPPPTPPAPAAADRHLTADPRVLQYRRMATILTATAVLHPTEKAAMIAAEPFWRRRAVRQRLTAEWETHEASALADAEALGALYQSAIDGLERALERLHSVGGVRVQGKVEDERARVTRARTALSEMGVALRDGDFGAAGKALKDADKELWTVGGPLLLELREASYARALQEKLAGNQQERRAARSIVEQVRRRQGEREALLASIEAHALMAEALTCTAEALAQQVEQGPRQRRARIGR